jgi:hypothetical protein
VYRHGVVVIKGQNDLLPTKQFDFVKRFDPTTMPKHGFGSGKRVKELGDALGVCLKPSTVNLTAI